MGRSGPTRDVELVEDDGPHDPAPSSAAGARDAAPGSPAVDAAARHRRRRTRLLGSGLLAAVVVAGAVGQGLTAADDRARLADLADHGSVLAPLDGPPTARWTSDAGLPRGLAGTTGGLLVGTDEHPDGAIVARALDLATGKAAWEVELVAAADRAELPPEDERFGTPGYCTTTGPDGRASDTVLCSVDDSVRVQENGVVREIPATVRRLLLLDARDGAVVADLSDAAGAAPVAEASLVLDDLVLLAGTDEDGVALRAVRHDGSEAWRRRFPVTADAEDGWRERPQLAVVDDHAVLVTPDAVRVVDATGTTVRRTARAPGTGLMGTTADAVVLATEGRGADSPAATTVLRRDGDVTYPGGWLPPGVDDGSAPFTVLTTDRDGLHAWDRTGTRLWTTDISTLDQPVVLDGRVHLRHGTSLVTLDGRTGDELWRVPSLRPGNDTPLMTDGRVLVVVTDPAPGDDDGPRLVALDPTDGSQVWRAPLPPDVDSLMAVHGTLLGYRPQADAMGRWKVTALG